LIQGRFGCLYFDLDLDVLADEHAAGFQCVIPGEAGLFADDDGFTREDRLLIAPWVGRQAALRHGSRCRLGDGLDGGVTAIVSSMERIRRRSLVRDGVQHVES
jgi:hypothetical protein